MFLVEKGIEVPMQEIDLGPGEHSSEAFRQKNTEATVPVPKLDDGTCISESGAICAYFEALAGRGAQRYRDFLEDLDERVGASEYVAGDVFSIADITAFVTIAFARRALNIDPEADQADIARWHEAVSSRSRTAV